jgi:drug/metabolite transporter (DMT)-like permease
LIKTIIVMLLAVTAGTIGDILLAKGMKELGDISLLNLRGILNVTIQALTTPKLIIGTFMLAIFFFLWLAVLSWEDLSVALPMQALNYVLVAFLSQYYLGEMVTPLRWAGTILVCIGVMLITRSGGGT